MDQAASSNLDQATSSHGKGFYSDKEAARKLGVSRITVLRMRQAGRIGFYRIGTRVVISEEQIQAFLAACERKACSQEGTVAAA